MDSGSEVPRKSKRRFQPRPPTPSLRQIAPTSNNEAKAQEEEDKRAARQLAKRIGIGQRRPKTETKASSSEVAFQPDFSSLTIRSFGVPKEDDKRASDANPSSPAINLPAASSVTARKVGEEVHNLVPRTEGDYVEPWDYKNSYYPTVLPLRKPYSGDPELLDKEEFGDMAKHLDYDENSINTAEELGLTSKQHRKKQMFFFKIPDCLPVLRKESTGANTKRSVSLNSSQRSKTVVKEESSGANTKRSGSGNSSKRSNPFEDLPEGFMGKMRVYKSGAVKMKLGDVLYDVSPGPNAQFHNDVAAIDDTVGRHICRIGSSANFVTVTPDVESLLKSASGMEIHK